MHLIISVASLSWTQVNQNPCMQFRLGVFQFDIFLSVDLRASACILTFGLSSSIHISVSMLFIESAFCHDLSVPISCSKTFLVWFPLRVWFSVCGLQRDTDFIADYAPAYIKSFNSMMSFAWIFVYKSFTFSVSDLTVLQPWFRSEGNVVFFSNMIVLVISTFIFSSWVNVSVSVFVM